MEFEDLVQLIESAAKNRGGATINNVQNSEGPAGMGSSSIGQGAVEISKPKKDWSMDKDKIGAGDRESDVALAKIKGRLRRSFSLMFNDPKFHTKINEILRSFASNNASWSLADEKRLEQVNVAQDNARNKVTGIKSDMDRLTINKRDAMGLRDDIKILKTTIASLKGSLKGETDVYTKKSIKDEIKDTQEELDNAEQRLSTMDKAEFDKVYMTRDAEYREAEIAYQKAIEDYEEFHNNKKFVLQELDKKNDTAEAALKNVITNYAAILADEVARKNSIDLHSLSELNWDMVPKNLEDKLAILNGLSQKDDTNPIYEFFNMLDRTNTTRNDFKADDLNKNVNIGSNKYFESLPVFTFARFWKSIAARGMERETISLKSDADEQTYNANIDALLSTLEAANTRVRWSDPDTRHNLLELIYKLPVKDSKKDEYANVVKGRWTQGRSPASKVSNVLAARIRKDLKIDKPLAESFDQVAARILSSCSFNDDAYKVSIVEAFSKRK